MFEKCYMCLFFEITENTNLNMTDGMMNINVKMGNM